MEPQGREDLLFRIWERGLSYALALVLGMALAWGMVLTARTPRGEPIHLKPPPTPPPVVVHVACAVTQPGVYALPPGARVADALQAAGGPQPQANIHALNLAAPLKDGQQICVPWQHDHAVGPLPQASATLAPAAKVNINTADIAQLEALPGIGPTLAQRIVAYREAHGPFASIDDLVHVPGIGPATLERLRPWITTGVEP